MISILSISLVFGLLYMFFNPCFRQKNVLRMQGEYPDYFWMLILVLIAFFVRIAGAFMYDGHSTDINCFKAWADMVYEGGFRGFYSSDSFTDYPPGYMYILYVIGWIGTVVKNTGVLVRLPAIITDILAGVGVYFVSRTKLSEKTSLTLSAFILLSPVLILNSALWGQVDIIYTLLLGIFIWLIYKKRLIPGYYVFAVAFFVKPQALIFTPILLCGMWETIFKNFETKKLVKHILWGCGALALVVVLSIPFGIKNTFEQYFTTLASYPYATINAFNVYGALGLNWADLTTITTAAGTISVIAIVAYIVFEYAKGNRNWFYLAGILSFATYMLSAKMHERYAFPAVLFFLMAYATVPNKKSMMVFILTSLSQFINTAWVLFVYETDINYYFKSPVIIVFSVVNILLFAYMIYCCRKCKKADEEEIQPVMELKKPFKIFQSKTIVKLTKIDVVLMLVLTLVYGGISFYDLGDKQGPETWYDLAQEPVSIDFPDGKYIDKLIIYPSCNDINETRNLVVSYTDEAGNGDAVIFDDQSVFSWNFIDFNKIVSNITFSTNSDRMMIMEVGLLGEDGLVELNGNELFDEQHLIPERDTYKNGTYFDEIYHARTGYEFVHGFDVYEWTHPPLGKVFIAAGIKLFGMNPFGWRVSGNIFGILMVPVFYIFAKKVFKKTSIAFLTTVLYTFDFMHFVQTRIATIDVYVTFFIMLMYLFMYKYYQSSFYDTSLKKIFAPLALTGMAFGLGVASKWTAVYACAGIALIYFMVCAQRYNEYYHLRVVGENLPFVSKFIKTCVFCVGAFIAVPLIIYVLSYIPYMNTEHANGLRTVIENQENIFVYHSETVLGSEHPFSSPWYTWPVMVRPIWYYSGTVSETVKEGISAFGNPVVWWGGIVAVVLNIYLAIFKKDRISIYLLIGYFSCLLPWIPVERTTYIYHYFPCVPFATLMIGNVFVHINKLSAKLGVWMYGVYAVIAVLMFVLFYPVLSGHGINVNFAETFLKWFNTWVLI